MTLLELKRRLNQEDLSQEEKAAIDFHIKKIEAATGLD